MKKFILLCVLYGGIISTAAAQENKRQKSDSLMTLQLTAEVKKTVALSAAQEKALYQAGVYTREQRRKLFQTYWKTDSFQYKLAYVEKEKDSLFRAILGDKGLRAYKASLYTKEKNNKRNP